MNIVVPRLLDVDLKRHAVEFLRLHHGTAAMPVDVEAIVDLKYQIDIAPLDNLQDDFGIDAYLTVDRKTVYVDRFVFEHRPHRYRFSLEKRDDIVPDLEAAD
jgi:hypothetical protein